MLIQHPTESKTEVYVPALGTALEDVDAAIVESESVNDVDVTEPLTESEVAKPLIALATALEDVDVALGES